MRLKAAFVIPTVALCIGMHALVRGIQNTETPSSPAPSAAQGYSQDACKNAKLAEQAVSNANTAAGNADTAAKMAKTATETASTAGEDAKQATGSAKGAAEYATKAGNTALDASKTARDAAERAITATDDLKKAVASQKIPRRSAARNHPLDDFVPCLFDGDEEFELRAVAPPDRDPNAPLDEQEAKVAANMIARSASVEVEKSGNKDLLKDKLDKFTQSVNSITWASITPSSIGKEVEKQAQQAGLNDQAAAIGNDAKTEINKLTNPKTTFDRPEDVSCSFSILGWHETSDNFGRRVANDYIAIQVNVRNLSQKNEFLIHDVQIAVDTGLTAVQLGRFQAGRDKLIVRNVAQRGQSEDRRNLIINTLQMIGGVAGGASAAQTQASPNSVTSQKLSTAVAIFQGAFITGLINIFPDHTLEHINHINDLAFSASSTSKTVVPIQGSVPLTTFLTEKPLEQLPFAHCGRAVKESIWHTWHDPHHNHDSGDPEDPGRAQFDFCDIHYDLRLDPPLQPSVYSEPLHYKKWEPAALRILQHRIYVVIAGIHIQELTSNPVVDKITCPILGDGSIDLSKADSSGTISCTLNGNHLDKIASIKLQQGTTSSIAGTFQAASEGNSATVGFKASDFKGVTGKYQLMLTDSTGKDIDSKQVLNFNVRIPHIASIVFTSPSNQDAVATIVGSNLDRIATVSLSDDPADGTKTITGSIQHQGNITSSDGTMTVIFTANDLKTLAAAPTKPRQFSYTTFDDAKDTKPVQVPNTTVIFAR